jgi:hypothetical protein
VRISAPISTFPDFTGGSWWTDHWHHWVFLKNGGTKQIWIDGKLFLEGLAATPLPTDFARIWLGAQGGGPNEGISYNMHGLIDDFAIFGTALTPAQVQQLATGTLPSALPASAKPLAYWDFNDVTVPEALPQITSAVISAGRIAIQWTGGGTLQSSLTLGPTASWTNVDSDGSYSEPVSGTKFFRVQR